MYTLTDQVIYGGVTLLGVLCMCLTESYVVQCIVGAITIFALLFLSEKFNV